MTQAIFSLQLRGNVGLCARNLLRPPPASPLAVQVCGLHRLGASPLLQMAHSQGWRSIGHIGHFVRQWSLASLELSCPFDAMRCANITHCSTSHTRVITGETRGASKAPFRIASSKCSHGWKCGGGFPRCLLGGEGLTWESPNELRVGVDRKKEIWLATCRIWVRSQRQITSRSMPVDNG